MLSSLLEFAMLFAFGFSWPFAIARTYRAKRVDGKSPLFMVIVIVGYLFGIAAHLVDGAKLWLCWIYLLDIALVSTDLALYCHYRRANSRAATTAAATSGCRAESGKRESESRANGSAR